jgi:PBSX family phage terminase large subunit
MEVNLLDSIAPVYDAFVDDVFAHDHTHYTAVGGRGSLKSSTISLIVPTLLMANKDFHAVVVRKVAETLRDTVYAQYVWAITQLCVNHYWQCKVSPMELTYRPTGQKILFRGADDKAKIKSIKAPFGYFAITHFEEFDQMFGREEIRSILQSTMRGGARFWNFESCNPPISRSNWANQDVLIERSDRLVHRSCYLDAPREWLGDQFFHEADVLKQLNEKAYRHEYLGEATGTGGTVFENVVTREVTDAEIRTFGATYAGLDHGWYPDPLHFVRCAYSPGSRTLIIYDEWRAWKQTSEAIFRHLADTKDGKSVTPAEEIIADSGGAQTKTNGDLRAYGMNVTDAAKGPGTPVMGIKWLQGLREIVIDPTRCPYASKEFLEYEYERTRKGEIVSAYPDKNNHAIDAVRYALNRVWLTRGA